jgi:serine/threonine protein kinase
VSLSVLLIQNDQESCDVQALLSSKVSDISIVTRPAHGLKIDLSSFDLLVVEKNNLVTQMKLQNLEMIVWDNFSDLSEKVDVYLQLQRHLKQYPITLSDWTLKEVLHNSESSTIYHAVSSAQNAKPTVKDVAIKFFKYKPQNLTAEKISQFIKQINEVSQQKPNGLVEVLDGGVTDNAFYLVMEYLNYGSLRQALNGCGNKLPLTHALSWFQEIVMALDDVHQKGLIHHDLKIDNILLRADGSLALLDYGVSKRILLDAGYISEGELHCSPHYVSPEQISGDSCTQKSDIYSLGVIFYELLVGRKPYSGKMAHELMMQQVMAPVPELPRELSAFQPLLDKMMAKNPRDRLCCAMDAIESLPMVA